MQHAVIAEPVPDEEIVARAVKRRQRDAVEALLGSPLPSYLRSALRAFHEEEYPVREIQHV